MTSSLKRRVIGIGETVLDILFKNDQPIKAVAGGSTLNAIVSLGRAGVPCALVSEVGDDHTGDLLCRHLLDNGVSTEYVCRHKESKSTVSLAFLDSHNEAHYAFYRDPAPATLHGDLPVFSSDDVVLFGSFFALNPALRPTVQNLLLAARQAGAWLYYDVNFRRPHLADLPAVLPFAEENMRLADVVRGSMEDFDLLLGLHDADAVYHRIQHLCHTLVLTDGPRPVRVFTPHAVDSYPVNPTTTVSTVGAGDNFNAGYIFAMMQGTECQSDRIAMALRWSQDVCRQTDNSISTALASTLKHPNT